MQSSASGFAGSCCNADYKAFFYSSFIELISKYASLSIRHIKERYRNVAKTPLAVKAVRSVREVATIKISLCTIFASKDLRDSCPEIDLDAFDDREYKRSQLAAKLIDPPEP